MIWRGVFNLALFLLLLGLFCYQYLFGMKGFLFIALLICVTYIYQKIRSNSKEEKNLPLNKKVLFTYSFKNKYLGSAMFLGFGVIVILIPTTFFLSSDAYDISRTAIMQNQMVLSKVGEIKKLSSLPRGYINTKGTPDKAEFVIKVTGTNQEVNVDVSLSRKDSSGKWSVNSLQVIEK
ncbi:cytochrome c oxidase assembly factor Coa1 family protein [Paenibacillus sp. 2RAB27]|uniref:hypothetical protein n=1 Tax=Paenibacillus sp. 2RAB27 TaxID=3232991 RepID=UPI003F9C694B